MIIRVSESKYINWTNQHLKVENNFIYFSDGHGIKCSSLEEAQKIARGLAHKKAKESGFLLFDLGE